MDNLVLLIKAASAAYYAHKLQDRDVIAEIVTLIDDIPKTKSSFVAEDKKVEQLLRKLVVWIAEQPLDAGVITSLLNTKTAEILIICPELESIMKTAFNDVETMTSREIIFQNIRDIKNIVNGNKMCYKLKNILKPIMFEGETDLTKEDWLKLADLLESKISSYSGLIDRAVMEEASINNPQQMIDILEQFKIDLSPEGILRTGFQGINKSLMPDGGFRRGMFWLINALTNRGKSFFLAHLLASFVLHNKPKLKDPTKIPTIFFCSAEDSMGLVLRRLFEIFLTAKTGVCPNFMEYSSEEIIEHIINTFNENGWHFAFYRVDPTHDNIRELKQRVRNLEVRGAEIIVGMYDYAAMMGLEGCAGETRSDKLQDLIRQLRNFWLARNALGITPHQLNPKAKEMLRENNDESEITFVKDIGGMSMTEGSTKITNEVDGEMSVHVAKLLNNKIYFTWYVGKVRGDGAPMADRYGIMEIEQDKDGKKGRGLVHDINEPKPLFFKTLISDDMLNDALML